jgi:hypothetical protein
MPRDARPEPRAAIPATRSFAEAQEEDFTRAPAGLTAVLYRGQAPSNVLALPPPPPALASHALGQEDLEQRLIGHIAFIRKRLQFLEQELR